MNMGTDSYRFTVGTIECIAVSDGTFAYPSATFVANTPVERFDQELIDHNLPPREVISPYTCLYINTGKNRLLVDTGAGFAPTNGKLLENLGIIRNRLKIASAIANAKAFLKVQKEFGSFDAYIWSFVGGKPIDGNRKKMGDIPAKTEISDALSKDLKKRAFNFVGSTIMYAFMQATGMVNDHAASCFRYKECRAISR